MSMLSFGEITFRTTKATGVAARGIMPVLSSVQAILTRYSVQLRMFTLSDDPDAKPPRLVFDEDDMGELSAFVLKHVHVVGKDCAKYNKADPLEFLGFEDLLKLAQAIIKPADALPASIAKKPKGGSAT